MSTSCYPEPTTVVALVTTSSATLTIAESLKSSAPWLPFGEGDCTEAAPLTILDTDTSCGRLRTCTCMEEP